MKRALAALLLLWLSLTPVRAEWWVPSPLSVIITVGGWISQGREEVFEIRVQARGENEVAAREEAFRVAVNQAVGSLMLSNTETQNGNVIRHEIINYASGYIHDFQIIGQRRVDNRVEMTLDIWVKKSGIADRIFGESRGTSKISGSQMHEQYQSLLHERQQGDRVLETVLQDYPRRAYSVKVLGHRQRIGSNRELELEIDTELSWDVNFLRALHEALGVTGNQNVQPHHHVTSVNYNTGGFFNSQIRVGFDDNYRSELLYRYFSGSNPHIMVKIKQSNDTALRICFSHNELTLTSYRPARRFVHSDERRTTIDGRLVTNPRLNFQIPARLARDLSGIEVEIVPQKVCEPHRKSHIYRNYVH